MPIYIKKDDDLSSIQIGSKLLSAVQLGAKIVWQAIRSCFGSGFWVNEKPWINNESWKNNN